MRLKIKIFTNTIMPTKMSMCFDNGKANELKIHRQDNTLPVKSSLYTVGFVNRNKPGNKSNFMNVAVLKKTKGGCSACGGR